AVGAEHQLAAQMPLRLEGLERVVAERQLPVASALRRTDVTAPDGSTHYQPPCAEIDVVPAYPPYPPDAKPGANGKGDHRPPLGVCRLEEPLALAEVQEVELRRRAPHPLHLGYVGEQLPVDRNRQNLSQDGEVVVDRFRRERGGELAGLVALDLAQRDLVE